MRESHWPASGADAVVLGPFSVEYKTGLAERTDEYRLRHRVFIEERRWLSDHSGSHQLERDRYDDECCALLLRDVLTGEAAACQRFILPDRLPEGLVPPVEELAGESIDFNAIPRTAWAEVSRSTVAPKYRWGSSATSLPAMVAIKHASIALALALDRALLFSLSDVRTARLTRRLGLALHQLGGPIAYHGQRALFRIDVEEARQSVPAGLQENLSALRRHAQRVLHLDAYTTSTQRVSTPTADL